MAQLAAAIELKNESQLATLADSNILALFFWASWNEPAKAMLTVVDELAKEVPAVTFVKVEAEKFTQLAEKHNVSSVPMVVFVQKGGKVVDSLAGADPQAFLEKAQKAAQLATGKGGASSSSSSSSASSSSAASSANLNTRLAKLVKAAPVMLFMKGTPQAPRCGFSRKTVELLKEVGATYGYFDILTDNDVRQGLKTFSNWPTYPQLYVNGKLLGGLDTLKEMHEDGELVEALPNTSTDSKAALNKRIAGLINRSKVMLFMKGSPDAPQCGFSRTMVGLLNKTGVKYDTFDILLDNDVRQGIKTYSNWPTFPQLYVNGKLIGGLDIAKELDEEDELADTLKAE